MEEPTRETLADMVHAASDRILEALDTKDSEYGKILASIAKIVKLADSERYRDLPQVIQGIVLRHDRYEQVLEKETVSPASPVQELSAEYVPAPPVVVHVHLHTHGGDV